MSCSTGLVRGDLLDQRSEEHPLIVPISVMVAHREQQPQVGTSSLMGNPLRTALGRQVRASGTYLCLLFSLEINYYKILRG